jgi:hypothetical protein
MADTYAGVAYATVGEFFAGDRPGWVRVPENDFAYYRLGSRWFIRCMVGCVLGRIGPATHSVDEHDDGTITVSPSLVMWQGWHGWLRRGVFEVIDYGGPPHA